ALPAELQPHGSAEATGVDRPRKGRAAIRCSGLRRAARVTRVTTQARRRAAQPRAGMLRRAPEWRNGQTQGTPNPPAREGRVGSTPPSGTARLRGAGARRTVAPARLEASNQRRGAASKSVSGKSVEERNGHAKESSSAGFVERAAGRRVARVREPRAG